MILVIGGAYQGKLNYVCQTFHVEKSRAADGESCSPEEIRRAAVLNHFHLLVKRLVKEGKDPFEAVRQILAENPDLIIISNELGYGVVRWTPLTGPTGRPQAGCAACWHRRLFRYTG